MTEAFWHMDTYPVRNRAAAAIYFMKITPKPSQLVNVGLYNSDSFNLVPFLPSQLLQKKIKSYLPFHFVNDVLSHGC